MKSLEEMFLKSEKEYPRIAVIGDIMLDEHVTVDVLGISPEDDLAWKLKVIQETSRPGGAANVAMNVKALGADVMLFGALGLDDPASDTLISKIKEAGIRLCCSSNADRLTTTKTRYLTRRGKHICRVDSENDHPVPFENTENWFGEMFVFNPQMIIISDYAKGVVTGTLIAELFRQKAPYIVDPKNKPLNWYGKALALTPNEKEFTRVACEGGVIINELQDCLAGEVPDYPGQALIVKRGGAGSEVFIAEQDCWKKYKDYNVRTREVGDPSGCGDSFISSLAYAISIGWDLDKACRLASASGACTYDHTGSHATTREELVKEIRSFEY